MSGSEFPSVESDPSIEPPIEELSPTAIVLPHPRRAALTSIGNIDFLSPRSQLSNLLSNRSLNFSCILKRTNNPSDLIDVILHRVKPLDVSTSFSEPELPSFLSLDDENEFFSGGLIQIYPKSLCFGTLPGGCEDTKEITLTYLGDTDACVEVKSSSELISLYTDNELTVQSTMNLMFSPYVPQRGLSVKLSSPNEQLDKQRVESKLTFRIGDKMCGILAISATIGLAELILVSPRIDIFPSVRKEESIFIRNVGNVPLSLGCFGPKKSSGCLSLSERHLSLQPNSENTALKVYFEPSSEIEEAEKGFILLQSLPNGPMTRIPYQIHNKELKDFPIEAEVPSLTWSTKDSHTTQSISLKNSTDSDIPIRLILYPEDIFSILDGGQRVPHKNVLFPSNSVLTFQLFCKVNDEARGKMLIKLLNTPFKASIPLIRPAPLTTLLEHPKKVILQPLGEERLSIKNASSSLLSWKSILSNPNGIHLSPDSGVLRPLESKELSLSFINPTIHNGALIFQSRTLDNNLTKCTSSKILLEQQPSRHRKRGSLSLKDSHLTFPPTPPGSESSSKIMIKNRTHKEEVLQLFILGGRGSPFTVPLSDIRVHPRSYLRFPVLFKPQSSGLHTSHIYLRNEEGLQLAACLCGEATED